ncbi:uncharacterized protein LOC122392978 [Amphibalanus amphitrite]|uniref:uncharacterized protein LOC122392978 n=1 Tax=Amphibalanus amphitrite TaxID=1232801 RepID=UPI001C9054FB|nr:uncharacterized protein LOC122392978 [Amphibalanus amphitrite]
MNELCIEQECYSSGSEGLASKIKAVSQLVKRRRQQVAQRRTMLREAVRSLLQPVEAAVPAPASRLPGLVARTAWQRLVSERWLVATDLTNETSTEVALPHLLACGGWHGPVAYESRLAAAPFELSAPAPAAGRLSPGATVRLIAVLDEPPVCGGGCRLTLTLASGPEEPRPASAAGFYQLPAGRVTLTADQRLARRHSLFSGPGPDAEADVQALWALSGRPLRLRLPRTAHLHLQAARLRLEQDAFIPVLAALTRAEPGDPLFGCLVLLAEEADNREAAAGALTAALWSRTERQMALLLHHLRRLLGSALELQRRPEPEPEQGQEPGAAGAQHLRRALLAQLQFAEAHIGDSTGGGAERRALRLGDVHVPLSEYGRWRRRLAQLELEAAMCALQLAERQPAAL